MTTLIIYKAGANGAGLNDFVCPALVQAGAPYEGVLSELEILVNGVEVTSGYTISEANVLSFAADLTAGDTLEVRRKTDYGDSVVEFPNPVKYSPVHNNKSITQFLYIVQELWDYILGYCMRLKGSASDFIWDFMGYRGTNIADPIDDTDVVNLRTLTTAIDNLFTMLRGSLEITGAGVPIDGELDSPSGTIEIDGNVFAALITIAGVTYLLRQVTDANGGTLTYDEGTNVTTASFTQPIYADSLAYAGIVFKEEN